MNNTIEQYTKGNIHLDLPEIILSDTVVEIAVEAGKKHSGTIIITNDRMQSMKGISYSSHRWLQLKENQFVGNENVIHYTIDAKNCEVSDILEGNITIICDSKELTIPVKATIVAASLRVEETNIKNLFQFTDLAKADWSKAISLFQDENFVSVLLSTEPEKYQNIYYNLLKGKSPSQALEEFLIAIHKKQPIHLSVSQQAFTYETLKEPILDTIIVTKDLWGYMDIKVNADADFIEVDQKLLSMEHFVGNQYSLQFQINPSKLRKGKNTGHIYLNTLLQTFEIEITCKQWNQISQEVIDQRKRKEYDKKLLLNYLDFRMQKIDFETYVTSSEEIIRSASSISNDEQLKFLEIHLLIIKGERLKAKEMLEGYNENQDQFKESNPVIYCAILYLKSLVFQDEVIIQSASDKIRDLYNHGHHEFLILWFLIYLGKRDVTTNKILLNELKEQFEIECHSPMLYYEAVSIYNTEPALLGELDSFTLQTMHFGAKKEFVMSDAAVQYAYLASKERYYKRIIFETLARLYEKYPTKDILLAICTTLIKGHQRAPKFFKWYQLGVENQLRVTELHEYYMYTIDEESVEPLPQQILLYFIYNSRLNDKKRAYLYARIVKEKEQNPSIYRTYIKKIEQFALKQLENENISENLAVLYDDLLEENFISQEQIPLISKVANCCRISCDNANIKGVYVDHKEIEEQKYVPMQDGKAYVTVLTEDASFYLVDDKEQRYTASVEFEKKRLMTLTEQLQTMMYAMGINVYPYVSSLAAAGAYRSFDEHTATLCKEAMNVHGLKPKYRNDLMEQLLLYYDMNHNSDALDYYLKNIDFNMLGRHGRKVILELCIESENFDVVFTTIQNYGYEDISTQKLKQLCLRRMESDEEKLTEEMYQDMCLCAFLNGSRDESLLSYLVQNYTGPTAMMLQLWRVAQECNISAHTLEEQLLAQVLFSHGDIQAIQEVFLSYYRYAQKSNVGHAYLNYAVAMYLMKNLQPRLDVLGCMKHEVLERKNLYCALGLLKYFATNIQEVIEDEKSFVETLLQMATNANILLPEFCQLEEKASLPNVMRNKCFIQYCSKGSGNLVRLHYRIKMSETSMTEYQTEIMTPTIFNLYVQGFVLFCNETLEYYFTEEVTDEVIQTEVANANYEQPKREYHSSFEQLNEMLSLHQQESSEAQDKLSNLIEHFVKKDYMIQHYFKTL